MRNKKSTFASLSLPRIASESHSDSSLGEANNDYTSSNNSDQNIPKKLRSQSFDDRNFIIQI